MNYYLVVDANSIHDDTIRKNVVEFLIGTINWDMLCFRCAGASDDNKVGEKIAIEQLAELVKNRVYFEPTSEG